MQHDLEALTSATGDKKNEAVPLQVVEPMPGYFCGGPPTFVYKRGFPTYGPSDP